MVDATAGCVWGWLRPSRVDVPAAGQAGCLAKAGTAARRRAGATIQACTVGASAIRERRYCVEQPVEVVGLGDGGDLEAVPARLRLRLGPDHDHRHAYARRRERPRP